jgi:hypothetical protein
MARRRSREDTKRRRGRPRGLSRTRSHRWRSARPTDAAIATTAHQILWTGWLPAPPLSLLQAPKVKLMELTGHNTGAAVQETCHRRQPKVLSDNGTHGVESEGPGTPPPPPPPPTHQTALQEPQTGQGNHCGKWKGSGHLARGTNCGPACPSSSTG